MYSRELYEAVQVVEYEWEVSNGTETVSCQRAGMSSLLISGGTESAYKQLELTQRRSEGAHSLQRIMVFQECFNCSTEVPDSISRCATCVT